MITISKYSQAPTFSSESCETLKLKVGLSSAANICPDLLSSINYDNLSSIEELEALVEGIKQDMKRKEILAQHKPAIKQLPSGKWYTRINGKKYERVNKKDLEDLIIYSYNSLNQVNLNSIFNSYLLYRKKVVSSRTWKKDIQYYESYIKNSNLAQKDLATLSLDDGYEFIDFCLLLLQRPEMATLFSVS